MPDIPPLVRKWTILRALAAHDEGATVREMAERMGVNQKTIRTPGLTEAGYRSRKGRMACIR